MGNPVVQLTSGYVMAMLCNLVPPSVLKEALFAIIDATPRPSAAALSAVEKHSA